MSKNVRDGGIAYTKYMQKGRKNSKYDPRLEPGMRLIYYVYDGSGYARQERRFPESGFLNEWHMGHDVYAWLGLPKDFGWSLTPTAIRHPGRALRRRKGGWGGARHGRGSAIDMLEGLRGECLAQAREECSEAPYLRYEAEWERRNGRKAPKSLYAACRKDI